MLIEKRVKVANKNRSNETPLHMLMKLKRSREKIELATMMLDQVGDKENQQIYIEEKTTKETRR